MKRFSSLLVLIPIVSELLTGCIGNSSCTPSHDSNKKSKDESSFQLSIPEPSGLAFSSSKDALYTVSDKNGVIYKISLKGDVLDKIPSGAHDLEGIDIDKTTGDIWIVEEKLQRIFHLDAEGNILDKIKDVNVRTKDNSGFEGIAKNGNLLYILIEKNPGTMIVYNITSKQWNKHKLSFADDFSGIDYDVTDNTLWIVSHESQTLNHCNTDGSLISSQEIDVKQAEGVAIDRENGIAWIIDDGGHKLHRIKIKI
jgi:uncharacterized protein YjiK